jgi:hypothetical protein
MLIHRYDRLTCGGRPCCMDWNINCDDTVFLHSSPLVTWQTQGLPLGVADPCVVVQARWQPLQATGEEAQQ